MTRLVATVLGGGELGSAIAHALALSGMRVLVLDQPLPGALRLHVAFAAAAVRPTGRLTVEGITGAHCRGRAGIEAAWARGEVALFTGPPPDGAAAHPLAGLGAAMLVDARMRHLTEAHPMTRLDAAPLVVGVGPGFLVGREVHVVIESNRGPRLGELITAGQAEAYTGVPGEVLGHGEERILRAVAAGRLERVLDLGAFVEIGDVVARVGGEPVRARLAGMVRGLKLDGVEVGAGHKVGDVDPRRDLALLHCITDKARAVGRGAVRAAVAAGLLPAAALGPSTGQPTPRSQPACT